MKTYNLQKCVILNRELNCQNTILHLFVFNQKNHQIDSSPFIISDKDARFFRSHDQIIIFLEPTFGRSRGGSDTEKLLRNLTK